MAVLAAGGAFWTQRFVSENEIRRKAAATVSSAPRDAAGEAQLPQLPAGAEAFRTTFELAAGPVANEVAEGAVAETAEAGRSGMPEHALSADDILRAMQQSYTTLQSYTDHGHHTRMWHELGRTYVNVPFRTFFKRPGYYRFEWLGETAPYRESYWSNASGAYHQKRFDAPLSFPSLAAAIKHAPMMGRFLVPLLMSGEAAEPFLTQAVRLGDDEADGVACYRVSGVARLTRKPCELWIGKLDFLIRRIVVVSQTAYSLSATPVYRGGSETLQIDFLDVTTDVSMPDELFTPPRS